MATNVAAPKFAPQKRPKREKAELGVSVFEVVCYASDAQQIFDMEPGIPLYLVDVSQPGKPSPWYAFKDRFEQFLGEGHAADFGSSLSQLVP